MENLNRPPASDPPGTRYQIWYKDLSDKGYQANKHSVQLPGAHASFQLAMAQALQFSKLRSYPVGVLYIVPVGENPHNGNAYSAVFG